MKKLLGDMAVFVNKYIRKEYKAGVAFLVGINIMDCGGIHFSYEKAEQLKEFLYLQKKDYLYVWDDYYKNRRDISLASYESDYEKNVLLAVQSNLVENIKDSVYAVARDADREWHRKPRVISNYQSMLLLMIKALQRTGIGDDVLFHKVQHAVEDLYQSVCITEMAQITLECLLLAAEVRNANRESYGEKQAALAVEYIDQHFDDCNLTMTELCEKLAISVSYFSTAFKNYTGKTFVEMLTDRRIREARYLLRNSDLKIYEVSERCGYSDSSYFSAIFKKSVGMTPKGYARDSK